MRRRPSFRKSTDVYGSEKDHSNDIGAAAFSPRTLATRRLHLRQITVALKKAGAIPMSMKIKDAALRCFNQNCINRVTKALMKKDDKDGRSLLEDLEEIHFHRRSSAGKHRAAAGAWSQGARATTGQLACSAGAGY